MKWHVSTDQSEELSRNCNLNEVLYNLAKKKTNKLFHAEKICAQGIKGGIRKELFFGGYK